MKPDIKMILKPLSLNLKEANVEAFHQKELFAAEISNEPSFIVAKK
jgi:hypothetical protein